MRDPGFDVATWADIPADAGLVPESDRACGVTNTPGPENGHQGDQLAVRATPTGQLSPFGPWVQ